MKTFPKMWIVVVSIIVMIMPAASCSKMSTLPFAFDGIMEAGIQNAPPVEVTVKTELPSVPTRLSVYTIISPDVDDAYAEKLAQSLGFTGKAASIAPGGHAPRIFV